MKRQERVAVVGIGKLGLCFALNLERAGYAVTGIDKNESYVKLLEQKEFNSAEPGVTALLRSAKNFFATVNLAEELSNHKLVFVMVPTHTMASGAYDHSAIDEVVAVIRSEGEAKEPRHLVISSTTMPGYCDRVAEELAPLGWSVSYNPEFIAQGTILANQAQPDMVLIGSENAELGAQIARVYERLCTNAPPIRQMSRKSAEITKLALNCFLTTKIAFANFVGDVATQSGADALAVLGAIGSDQRVGSRFLSYGYGFGGPCLPRDNRAFAAFTESVGMHSLVGVATDQANRAHLDFQVAQFLAQNPAGASVELGPVSYKKESVSIEASQQLEYAVRLAEAGCKVTIRDAKPVLEQVRAQYGELFVGYREL